MAEKDIPISNNHDFRGNKIKNAKVPSVPVAGDDIANKDYVDSNAANQISTTRVTDYFAGNIPVGTDIDTQTALEILTNIFFGVIPPVYTLPTVALTVNDALLVPIVDNHFEVGLTLTNYQLSASVTLNDATGLDGALPFQFNTPSTTVNINPSTLIFTEQIVEGTNNFSVNVDILGAATENDNTGTPNPTGIFFDDVYTAQIDLIGVWPYYTYFGPTSGEPEYTTPSEIKALTKVVVPLPSEIIYTIPKDVPTTIIVAVPTQKEIHMALEGTDINALHFMSSIMHQQIEGVNTNDIVVDNPIGTLYTILEDLESAGDTEVYSLAIYRTIKGFPKDMDITITYKDITGAPIEESTYMDTYYSDENYTD